MYIVYHKLTEYANEVNIFFIRFPPHSFKNGIYSDINRAWNFKLYDKFRTFRTRAAYTSIMILEGFFALLSNVMILTAGIDSHNSFPRPLSKEKEREFLLKAASGDKSAKDALVKHNLRLVAYIAKKYVNYPDKDELVSVGTVGLIKAINSYTPEKSATLATYASRCIENEILMAMRGYKKRRNDISIYEKVGMDREEGDVTLADMLSMEEDSVWAKIENGFLKELLTKLIEENLTEREKFLILSRFGIDSGSPKTQQQTAKLMGISRSYVSRIEKAALEKLRAAIKRENLEF